MTDRTNQNKAKREGRSPGYPAIDLETAIDRARTIKNNAARHFSYMSTVLSHWGYGPKSSQGLLVLAALKKFGLFEGRGKGKDRELRLTDLAWNILIDDRENSTEKAALIQEAALKPDIHQKLWERYGSDLPADEDLQVRLKKDEGFTSGAVGPFILEYKRTLAFAKLGQSDMLSSDDRDKESQSEGSSMQGQTLPTPSTMGGTGASTAQMGAISFPITHGKWVKMELPFGLTEKEWSQLKEKLEVFKSGFIKVEEEEDQTGD